MAKMKIYEISRSLQGAFPDLKSKDLIKLLQENGFKLTIVSHKCLDYAYDNIYLVKRICF